MHTLRRRWILALVGTALCHSGRSDAVPAASPPSQPPAVRKSAAATLVRLLDDPSPAVRTQAMIGLSRTHPPEAAPLLIPMLQSRDPKRVSLAIDLLATIKTRDAILPLLRLAAAPPRRCGQDGLACGDSAAALLRAASFSGSSSLL